LALGARWHAHVGGTLGATSTPLSPSLPQSLPAPSLPSAPTVRLAVVGAHLSGLPLNRQLTERGAYLVWAGTTAPIYRLFALPDTTPPKPGLLRVDVDGAAIALEVWELSSAAFGSFSAAVPPPLCIGTVTLSDDAEVKGFLCEPHALAGATDVTRFGGWRNYLASR
ncbi:MAG: allophanate hydrolase, partial [Verrucomicrobia bacterium]|nr:allophanate hydrolase [Verrucomicrobiota bacterium]